MPISHVVECIGRLAFRTIAELLCMCAVNENAEKSQLSARAGPGGTIDHQIVPFQTPHQNAPRFSTPNGFHFRAHLLDGFM